MRREGRLIVAGFGASSPDREPLRLIRELGVAGLILFARNIENPRQVASLADALQKEAIARLERPLFIMVDQEGGPVARLRDPFTHPPSAREAASLSLEEIERVWSRSAREMRSVGINLNLAPVADLSEEEGYMAERSFGPDPDAASELVGLFVDAMASGGVMACAKHFPGLGAAQKDPHREEAVVERSPDEIDEVELAPFREATARDVAFLMTSHGLYPALDENLPGTLSPKVLGLARERLGFRGPIITDDLEMGAVAAVMDVGEASVAALNAGADLALVCSGEEAAEAAFESLVKAREQNLLSEDKVAASLERQHSLLKGRVRDPFAAPPSRLAKLFGRVQS